MAKYCQGSKFTPMIVTSVGVFYRKGMIPAQDLEPLTPVQPGPFAVTQGLARVNVDPITVMVSNVMRGR